MARTDSRTAVIVSGGKQYLVTEGDRILVDRLASEPGSEFAVEQVLMTRVDDKPAFGADAAKISVTARVVRHQRGPKLMAFRYKSKKRVRVHRGSRADLTAIEIVSVGPAGEKKQEKPAAEPAASRGRARAAAAPRGSKESKDKKEQGQDGS